jgi:hypothetical protein
MAAYFALSQDGIRTMPFYFGLPSRVSCHH